MVWLRKEQICIIKPFLSEIFVHLPDREEVGNKGLF